MIEQLSEEPRLELFGRLYCLGWISWGDELGIRIGGTKCHLENEVKAKSLLLSA